jgi:hypothetical protein
VLLPYSNDQVVASPFGLTVPVTVAVVAEKAVTAPVTAVGAEAAPADPASTAAAAAASAAEPSRRLVTGLDAIIATESVPAPRKDSARKAQAFPAVSGCR